MNLHELEPTPEERVAQVTASGRNQPLVPRSFKTLLVMALPFGAIYQEAGLFWAVGVSAVVAVAFLIGVAVYGAVRQRL